MLYETHIRFAGEEALKLAQVWQQDESKEASALAWQMVDENDVQPPSENNNVGVEASEGDKNSDNDEIETNEGGDQSVPDISVYKPIDLSKAGVRKSKRSTKSVRRLNLMTTLGFITTLCVSSSR